MQAGTLVFALRPFRIRFALAVGCSAAILLGARFVLGRPIPPLAAPAFTILLGSVIIFQWAARRALVRAQFPPNFMRVYGISQLLDLAGYVSLLGSKHSCARACLSCWALTIVGGVREAR
jgi:hypothetical protein